MPALYLDIETIPTQRQDVCDYLEESLRDELAASLDGVRAPANYKDAEKIAEYIVNKKAELQAEFLNKLQQKIDATGLDGAFGHVFCIGWALEDEDATCSFGTDERLVLSTFAQTLRIPPKDAFNVTIVGHNVSAFDLRFLYQRFIVHGMRPPTVIARAVQAKPWESEKVFDTMVQWAGVSNRISLDKLCLALSIESPKGDMDGSKVWPMVQEGKHDEVARYCARDVEATRQVHRRMIFADAGLKLAA